jgi:hypothetical protein
VTLATRLVSNKLRAGRNTMRIPFRARAGLAVNNFGTVYNNHDD